MNKPTKHFVEVAKKATYALVLFQGEELNRNAPYLVAYSEEKSEVKFYDCMNECHDLDLDLAENVIVDYGEGGKFKVKELDAENGEVTEYELKFFIEYKF